VRDQGRVRIPDHGAPHDIPAQAAPSVEVRRSRKRGRGVHSKCPNVPE
jgi:hypothetical protein